MIKCNINSHYYYYLHLFVMPTPTHTAHSQSSSDTRNTELTPKTMVVTVRASCATLLSLWDGNACRCTVAHCSELSDHLLKNITAVFE